MCRLTNVDSERTEVSLYIIMRRFYKTDFKSLCKTESAYYDVTRHQQTVYYWYKQIPYDINSNIIGYLILGNQTSSVVMSMEIQHGNLLDKNDIYL